MGIGDNGCHREIYTRSIYLPQRPHPQLDFLVQSNEESGTADEGIVSPAP